VKFKDGGKVEKDDLIVVLGHASRPERARRAIQERSPAANGYRRGGKRSRASAG